MRKKTSDKSAELAHQANGKYLESKQLELVREMYQTLQRSGLEKFTLSFIDSKLNDLRTVLYDLDCLPEPVFKEMMEVMKGLSEARNELRLARFLFHVEEIEPVHRLVMRNRAVLRGKDILHRVVSLWPYYNSSHE